MCVSPVCHFHLPLSSHQRCQAIHCAAATGQEAVCKVLFASPELQENIISREKEMKEEVCPNYMK